jgi:hypothetical protein
VRNLKLSYKIADYIDWISTNPYPKLVPGESIVDCWYPSFPPSIAQLTTRTNSNLQLKIQYQDASGKAYEEDRTKSFVLLGRNEFVSTNMEPEECKDWNDFNSNAGLLAAFVTPEDAPLRVFADIANKVAGGIPSSDSDEHALKVISACFSTMRDYGITYVTPTGNIWGDEVLVQHIQYPRDTIEENSGTCVDLSILLDAMCEKLGLKTFLFLLPGHCIPIIELPIGKTILPVESTVVGENVSFEDAVSKAQDEVTNAVKTGKFYLIDVAAMRGLGILNPELPDRSDLVNRINDWAAEVNPQADAGTTIEAPTQTEWLTYREPSGLFTIAYPQGWNVQQTQSGILEFADQTTGGGSEIIIVTDPTKCQGGSQGLWTYAEQTLRGYYADLQLGQRQQATVGGYSAVVYAVAATDPSTNQKFVATEICIASPNGQRGLWFRFLAPSQLSSQYRDKFNYMINSISIAF